MQTRTAFSLNSPRRIRAGFTLVEMLVAVGLVVLMLAMFGEVFSIATKSMSKMKGVSENDQKARMLNILIRGDLNTMSYRQVPGEFGIRALDSSDNTAQKSSLLSGVCNGYLYISENNPNDNTDDLIQFTIDTQYAPADLDGSDTQLFARALQFGWNTGPFAPPNDTSMKDLLYHNPDQPMFDDQAGRYTTGTLTSDQTGSSQFAEVTYFVRNGNLYRRQLLIRQPIDTTKQDDQPMRPDGTALIPNNTPYSAALIWNPVTPAGTDNPLSTGSFWGDFDYSAIWKNGVLTFVGNQGGALSNFNASAKYSLGLPQNRFGFGPFQQTVRLSNSIDYTADGSYIGRFTQLETSDPNFSWPGSPGAGADNVYYTGDDTNPLTSTKTSVINGVAAMNGTNYNGTRVSQDLLLTNVHEFDIKVWDDWATNPITGMTGMFVDIGGANAMKYLTSNNQSFGSNNPLGLGANVYDTWSPFAKDVTGLNAAVAPFRNFDNGPDGAPGKAGVDDDGKNGVDDNLGGENGWPGTDDWHDMKAIAIHIRYYDIPSDSMRDLTIIHSFVE